MRTKVLCAAALAAGALTSMAQVYSANVVGYVNVTLTGGGAYTMIANPLDATMGGTVAGGNNITNLFASVAHNGDTIFRWNVGTGDFDSVQPTKFPTGWDSNFDLNPGEGVFYNNNSASSVTLTFVGQVVQGAWAYPGAAALGGTANMIPGGGAYSALGAPAPIGGSFTNAIAGIPAQNGDTVFTWDYTIGDFGAVQPTKFPSGWSDTGVTIAPGIGFFYNNNSGSAYTWTSNFTVQ